jgi:hypothetical protein
MAVRLSFPTVSNREENLLRHNHRDRLGILLEDDDAAATFARRQQRGGSARALVQHGRNNGTPAEAPRSAIGVRR